MSGICIPWMSMPKTCDDCQVSADCPNDEHIDGYNMQNRPRFCQLIPVPEHGDLIDRDKLEKDIDNYIGGEESRSRFHHWVQVQRSVILKSEEEQT